MTDFSAAKLRELHEDRKKLRQLAAILQGMSDADIQHSHYNEAQIHLSASRAILAMAEREKRMREAGNRLAFAAGALNIATDSAEHLKGERGNVLDALKGWESALGEEKA